MMISETARLTIWGRYEKNGFVFVRDYHMVSDDARWKDRPPAGQFAWLVRPKKQEA